MEHHVTPATLEGAIRWDDKRGLKRQRFDEKICVFDSSAGEYSSPLGAEHQQFVARGQSLVHYVAKHLRKIRDVGPGKSRRYGFYPAK